MNRKYIIYIVSFLALISFVLGFAIFNKYGNDGGEFTAYEQAKESRAGILPSEAETIMETEILNNTDSESENYLSVSNTENQDINNTAPETSKAVEMIDYTIDIAVPFASQAPFGEWNDPRQQDGCEEAAVLMAMRWVRGQNLTKEEARAEILSISEYQENNFGEYRDTSAADTADRIIKGYFGYDNYELKTAFSAADIVNELIKGNIVILPMSGQALGNPNFTPPGPERHMVLVRGHDPSTGEFITNDPGTRKGEGYRYNERVFFNAIRDYPTGYHENIASLSKTIIIIKKNSAGG